MSVRILKFGGTSLGSPAAMRAAVARIREARRERPVVVVASALAGTTDRLARALEQAVARDPAGAATVGELAARHRAQLAELAPGADGAKVLGPMLERLAELLAAVALLRDCPPHVRDETLSLGERLAAPLLGAGLADAGIDAETVDAADLLRTDSRFGNAALDWPVTARQVVARLGRRAPGTVAVVPGFFGADAQGRIALLGRGASDWSATILGAALAAERIEIWTDVDGVLSADPRLVPAAFLLPELAYGDAAELAAFGAKVLHPGAVEPAERAGVPVWIRNSFRPDGAGTWIRAAPRASDHPRGVATRAAALVEIRGGPGRAAQALAACDRLGLEILGLQQGSARSELALVLPEPGAAALVPTLAQDLRVRAGLAVVALVGRGAAPLPSIREVLAAQGIRPRLVFERPGAPSVAALVDGEQRGAAVGALHECLAVCRPERAREAATG